MLLFSSFSALSLASYYGDNMVLQKAPKSSQIWGFADVVGSTVTVTLGTQVRVHTKVYIDNTIGKTVWNVMLPPQKGTPVCNDILQCQPFNNSTNEFGKKSTQV